MERRMQIKYIMTLTIVLLSAMFSNAQSPSVTYNHDSQKYKQVDVIENGNWDFAPDFYYYSLHKNYSGASWNTKWTPFPSFSIKFNETKSSVGRCGPTRSLSAVTENEVLKKTRLQLDSITPIYQEELVRSADRNIDVAYTSFKGEFSDMQDAISSNLKFVLERSKGKLNKTVSAYADANDLICERINYIHKTGLNVELENTKREIAYEEIRQDMKNLLKATNQLVFYAASHYEKE